MQLTLSCDPLRAIDDLLEIRVVMRRVLGDDFPEAEIAGDPRTVRPAFDGTPVFQYPGVNYLRRRDGGVSEARRCGAYVGFRFYEADGSLRSEEVARSGRPRGPTHAQLLPFLRRPAVPAGN